MQALSVLGKVLRAEHELAHSFKRDLGLLRDLVPSPLQTSNRCGAQSGDDGCDGGVVVQLSAFLQVC